MTLPPGRVFTPPHVAQTLWRAVSDALCDSGSTGPWTIAEPAAGIGALLTPALGDPRVRRLFGVELCGQDLSTWPDDARLCATHADALTLCGEDSPASLLGGRFNALSPGQLVGPQCALLRQGWADAVIANPPYMRETGNAAHFRELRAWNDAHWRSFYRKNADLHHFFWPLAVRWLRPGGVLGFITPAYFLESEAATPVRELLATSGEVLGIWRATHESTFDVGVEASITLWRKHDMRTAATAGAQAAPRLDEDLVRLGDTIAVPSDGGPWWWFDPQGSANDICLDESRDCRLGDIFSIVEGVSTGANRTRAKDGPVEGVLVLTGAELAALGLSRESRDRFVRQRWRWAPGPDEWVLLIPDQSLAFLDLPCPDNERLVATGPHAALAAHLLRHKERLRGRAEMRRNARRSWYATAWPRGQQDAEASGVTLCTPKWSAKPAFTLVPTTHIAMTDYRQLAPRSPMTPVELERWSEHLNAQGERFARRLKRKARLLEFYGPALADIRIPLLPTHDAAG